ncbi:hypothetical protein EV1_014839 [Malus domestica]
MVNMISISIDVAIAAYGEARFDTWGVILQLGTVTFEVTLLVLIQILLTSKGITLTPSHLSTMSRLAAWLSTLSPRLSSTRFYAIHRASISIFLFLGPILFVHLLLISPCSCSSERPRHG